LGEMLQESHSALCDAINQDFGRRSPAETLLLEVFPTLELIRFCQKNLKGWLASEKRPTGLWMLPGKCELHPRPKGVVGIMVPWNFPLFLSLAPLAQALAAGNRAMIKLPEACPQFNAVLKKALARQFSLDLVAVVEGGPEAGAEFASLPFNHLLFTGSTSVGKAVMAAASQNLTPVTLELGGKSPVIVLDETELERAAAKGIWAKSLNAGQTCVSPDYVLVPQGQEQVFADLLQKQFHKLYPKWPINPDYTSLIRPQAAVRMQDLLAEAIALGCKIQVLAKDEAKEQRRIYAPHLVFNPPLTSRVMLEELFCPILPVLGYANQAEALSIIAHNPNPLALYLFGEVEKAKAWALDLPTGGICINDCLLQVAQEGLPFGGVGSSGMGQYHGHEGFLTFSQMKPVFIQPKTNLSSLIQPPYGHLFQGLVKMMTRTRE